MKNKEVSNFPYQQFFNHLKLSHVRVTLTSSNIPEAYKLFVYNLLKKKKRINYKKKNTENIIFINYYTINFIIIYLVLPVP